MNNEGSEKKNKRKNSKRRRKDSTTNVGKPKNLQNVVLQHSNNWTNDPDCLNFIKKLTNFGRFNQYQRTKQVVETNVPRKKKEKLAQIHDQLKDIEINQGEGSLYYLFKKQPNIPVFRDGQLDIYMVEVLPQDIMEKCPLLRMTWPLFDLRFLEDLCKYLNNENLVIKADVELYQQDTLIRCSVAHYLISNIILPKESIVKWFANLSQEEEEHIMINANLMKNAIMGIIERNIQQTQQKSYVSYPVHEFLVNQSQEYGNPHSYTDYRYDEDL